MAKVWSSIKLLATICGGWFGFMSGGISIPLTFALLFWHPTQAVALAVLAFLGLFVLIVSMGIQNHKLIEAQGRQFKTTLNDQNDLLRRQVEIAESEKKSRIERERRESLPLIKWRGGSQVQAQKTCEFVNVGARALNLSVSTDANAHIWITPVEFLEANGSGKIEIVSRTTELVTPFKFKISCLTMLEERVSTTFRVESLTSSPVSVES